MVAGRKAKVGMLRYVGLCRPVEVDDAQVRLSSRAPVARAGARGDESDDLAAIILVTS